MIRNLEARQQDIERANELCLGSEELISNVCLVALLLSADIGLPVSVGQHCATVWYGKEPKPGLESSTFELNKEAKDLVEAFDSNTAKPGRFQVITPEYVDRSIEKYFEKSRDSGNLGELVGVKPT